MTTRDRLVEQACKLDELRRLAWLQTSAQTRGRDSTKPAVGDRARRRCTARGLSPSMDVAPET